MGTTLCKAFASLLLVTIERILPEFPETTFCVSPADTTHVSACRLYVIRNSRVSNGPWHRVRGASISKRVGAPASFGVFSSVLFLRVCVQSCHLLPGRANPTRGRIKQQVEEPSSNWRKYNANGTHLNSCSLSGSAIATLVNSCQTSRAHEPSESGME